MRKIILICILSFAFTQLKAQQYIFPRGKNKPVPTLDTPQYYFPLFRSKDNIMPDTATVIRRSAYLKAINEPVLYTDLSHNGTFRFTWLRSADHPVVVRVVRDGDHCTLYWKESDGTGNTVPGKLIVDKQTTMRSSDWGKFRRMLLKINTCAIDTTGHPLPGTHSEWIMEGFEGGYFQYSEFYTPGPTNAMYKACDYLMSFTDLVIAPGRKY